MSDSWKDLLCIVIVAGVWGIIIHFAVVRFGDTRELNKNTGVLIEYTKCIEELADTEVKLWQAKTELDNCWYDYSELATRCVLKK